MTLLRVPDLAAPQQHVVQIQRIALILPQHCPRELIQTIVWFFALNERYKQSNASGDGFRKEELMLPFFWTTTLTIKCC